MKNSGASHLRKILERAREEVPSRLRVYVFDLDSTLFDVEPRMMAILKAFAQEPVWIGKHSGACKKLIELKHLPRTFHFENILNELGLQNESQEFRADVLEFWRTRFFCNVWLHLDCPYPGAQEYLQKLGQLGAPVIYLTSRFERAMLEGTIESLKQWNFPVAEPQFQLALKPVESLDDAEFKQVYLRELAKTWPNITLFENEPANIFLAKKDNPEIEFVFIDTVHAGTHEVEEGVLWIDNFLLQD
jgi:hypothetical protein